MSIYRKIYEQHFGPIPRDTDGRTYEIHHIDNNHNNNDIKNLICVSIQEHYDIHYRQEDWAACFRISQRLKISPEEKSKLATMFNLKRVQDGTHPWLDGEKVSIRHREAVDAGTHHFLGPEVNRRRVENGTHHFLGPEVNRKKLEDGTHPWVGPEHNRKMIKDGKHPLVGPENNRKMIENGTHPFLNGELSRATHKRRLASGTSHLIAQYTCPHCNKEGKGPAMKTYHFDNCKSKNV